MRRQVSFDWGVYTDLTMKLTKQTTSRNLPFIPDYTIGMDLGDRVHHYYVL